MRLPSSFALALLIGCSAVQPPGQISGTAILAGTRDHSGTYVLLYAAPGEPVKSSGHDLAVYTTQDGRFTFKDVPPGRYTLVAVQPRFVTAALPARSVPAVTTRYTLSLSRRVLPARLESVKIVGDLQRWDERQAVPLKLVRGRWTETLHVPAGQHEYKFILNDARPWVEDVNAVLFHYDGDWGVNSAVNLQRAGDVTFVLDSRSRGWTAR